MCAAEQQELLALVDRDAIRDLIFRYSDSRATAVATACVTLGASATSAVRRPHNRARAGNRCACMAATRAQDRGARSLHR
jgi:hypothetical protein